MISSTTGQELTSSGMLGYYLNKSYADAAAAKERGELICWSSSIAPNEFCEAMGIHVIYPENHAAAVAAKGGALDLLEVAEKKGYSARMPVSIWRIWTCRIVWRRIFRCLTL